MANLRKTVKGKMIDMDKLKLSSEKVAAVGNARTNARGDFLGVGNSIAAGRNKVMDQVYAVQSAPLPSAGYSPTPVVSTPVVKSIATEFTELVAATPTTDAPIAKARNNPSSTVKK
jgi:hypothetical protein